MVDILIIGAGGAGLSAALSAKNNGAKVLIVGKTNLTSSQTTMAQGGINASLGNLDADSIDSHIQDTLKSSHELGDKEMIEYMCQNASLSIQWLEHLGVPFSRLENTSNAKKGIETIAQRRLGGASHKRACYAQDYTGLKILHTLYDNIIKEDIEFINDYFLLDITTHNGYATGAIFLDTKDSSIVHIQAKSIILATGGYAGVYDRYTTNAYGVVGDGIVSAYKAGASVSDMEFVQFHPTALQGSSILISESARGEGGYLLNSDGERFVDELKPRDEVARAIFEQIQQNKQVYLDIRHLGKQKLQELLPQELELCKLHEGVNPTEELIPIKPVAHYSMGGIAVDKNLEVNEIKRCFAIGECSNTNIHGANRLGGNSLLEIITFGKKAGEFIAKNIQNISIHTKSNDTTSSHTHIEKIFAQKSIDIYSLKKELGEIMYNKVGIQREKITLLQAKQDILNLQTKLHNAGVADKSKSYNQNLVEYLELENALSISSLIINSALKREESRGAHYRSDFPSIDKKFAKHTLLRRDI